MSLDKLVSSNSRFSSVSVLVEDGVVEVVVR